jgi:hypothetical protein
MRRFTTEGLTEQVRPSLFPSCDPSRTFGSASTLELHLTRSTLPPAFRAGAARSLCPPQLPRKQSALFRVDNRFSHNWLPIMAQTGHNSLTV